jgi:acetyl esterase/lipase
LAKDAIYGMRENQAKTRKPLSPIPPHVKVVDQTIPMRDRAEIPIRIYSPANHNGKRSPLIVNCHGGGYMLGGLWMGHEFGINVVTLFNAVLVDVGYRMCPEYPFPTPVNDSWDALKWASQPLYSDIKDFLID